MSITHRIVEEDGEFPESQNNRQIVQQVREVSVPSVDYDLDDDGLIEVGSRSQLHALRWDLDGDEAADKEEFVGAYGEAFPGSIENMGVPADVPVRGYELSGDLDFGKNPASWESIGILQKPFQAVLEGNGYGILNLFQDQSDVALFAGKPSGLFGVVSDRGRVINLGLEGVDIEGINWVGGLVGLNQGRIENCSVRGRVVGANSVGGLVGHNFEGIADSHVHAAVRGNIAVGGLVGWNVGGAIEGSTAPGEESLGLVGFGTPAGR